MMTNLTNLTIAAARDGLAKGDFTAVELTRAHIAAIEAKRDLNAFITETPDLALEQAKESDARRQAGRAGSLDGIPLGIKDLFCTKGVRTSAASHILDGFTPQYESTVTANLKAAGAVSLGKLNLDEFAMGSSNLTSYYGGAVNPWTKSPTLPPSWCPAARRVVRPPQSPPVWSWAPPAPTPAARSASPPPSAASPASSRPMAAARAGASWPSPARWTRPARWPARWKTAPCC
jgi:hypothetical protein